MMFINEVYAVQKYIWKSNIYKYLSLYVFMTIHPKHFLIIEQAIIIYKLNFITFLP